METLITFLEDNLSFQLLAIIVFGGIFLTKYTKAITIIKDAYKVLIASVVVSVAFYYFDGCGRECLAKYFFTYLFATSFYELFVKWLLSKITKLTSTK